METTVLPAKTAQLETGALTNTGVSSPADARSETGSADVPGQSRNAIGKAHTPADEALPSDGTLVALVLAGDTESFANIVGRYQPALLRVAVSRLGNIELAEDAVQESFVNAFKSLATYDSRYSFRTWLWTILLNQCRRQYKQHRQRSDAEQSLRDQADAEPQSTESDVATHLTHQEDHQLLERLLAGLPDAQADALRLRFFGELKFQEIADAMGCSLSSAKIRVRRGLATLSDLVKPTNGE